VSTGNRVTEQAQQTMHGALDSVRQVSQAIVEISDGAQQQLHGISQVNEAVSQMDGITQQNAALVEQIAASALQLQTQSASVAEAVQVFRLDQAAPAALPDAVALRRAAKVLEPVPT
jgi:aerotaxis receptor